MAEADPQQAFVSKDGHVELPRAIREAQHWGAGTRLTFESTPDGVLIRADAPLPRTTVDEVFGILQYDGRAISIEDMYGSVFREARRRFDNGEY